MDRFEDFITLQQTIKSAIYIPVWIDLKGDFTIKTLNELTHLHSSMDRFEDFAIN